MGGEERGVGFEGRVPNLLRSHGFFVIRNEDMLTVVLMYGQVPKVQSNSFRTEMMRQYTD